MTLRNTPPAVTVATVEERDRVIAAMVTAFAADPFIRWMLPDASQYLQHFPLVGGTYAGRAFEHGSAWRTDDFAGAALWLPPGVSPDEEALGAIMLTAVAPDLHGEVFGVLELIGAAHPAEEHWFLPTIGVDPIAQGRGLGSVLLSRSLERCDREHRIAYLESTNPRNVPFYERHGFDVIGEIQVGSSPVVTPMLRAAR